MNIFKKRPLCLILCIGLSGFFLFTFENIILRISLIVIGLLPFIFSFISTFEKRHLIMMRISGIVILLSILLSYLYFDRTFNLYERYDDEVEVVGVVEEIAPASNSYTERLLIRIESINGKKTKNYRVYAYPARADALGIMDNTRIRFTTVFGGFSKESKFYNVGKGINAYANDIDNIEIIMQTNGGLRGRITRIRQYASRAITMMSDPESGSLLSALLLGERDNLPDQLRLDFKRIGISHILALSGMHLAVLSLGLGAILSAAGVKKKTRVLITSGFVVVYMALTGFSVSVCRAGIMLLISSVLYLLGYGKDSFTSLAVAVFLIGLFTPYAIFDISLWLSALATFGIIAYAEYYKYNENKEKVQGRIRKFLLASAMPSVFAISATLFVSTFSFGGFSIMSIITTLIFSILAELIMYLGCIMVLIGWLIPIGFLITPLTRIVYILARFFSSFKFSLISSNFLFAKIAVILYTLFFFGFIVLSIKNKERWIKALLISFAAVMIIPTVVTVAQTHKETVSYYAEYRSDFMLIRSKNQVCLINSSQYSKSTAYSGIDLLEDANVTYLDKYYLTHYSWSVDEDVETLLYNISVEEIYLPEPRNDDERTILKILYKSVEKSNAKIKLYSTEDSLSVGKYDIKLLYSAPYGQTSMNAFAITKGDFTYTYVSSGLIDSGFDMVFYDYISNADCLIFGNHGKKYKDKIYLTDCFDDLDLMILHSENLFLKQSNMQYYIDKGCDILSHPEGIFYFDIK